MIRWCEFYDSFWIFSPQHQWWPTCSWRPCCPLRTFSFSMWETLMSSRLGASQTPSTFHVSNYSHYSALRVWQTSLYSHFRVGVFLTLPCLRVSFLQWASWRSGWNWPHTCSSRSLTSPFLGSKTTTSCFTAEVATGVPRLSPLLVGLDFTGKSIQPVCCCHSVHVWFGSQPVSVEQRPGFFSDERFPVKLDINISETHFHVGISVNNY